MIFAGHVPKYFPMSQPTYIQNNDGTYQNSLSWGWRGILINILYKVYEETGNKWIYSIFFSLSGAMFDPTGAGYTVFTKTHEKTKHTDL